MFKRKIRGKRGSPLLEEGILLGLSLFMFLIIASMVLGILDWSSNNFDEALDAISDLD
ncbi:MAG: hypothetical protein Q6362_000915 [Candidatus Wukongarchaeota archaeon]|jgi:hypothetical protein|nr:hypothetical protein [Candidatus Wukongarchaeota archaeon]MDO8128000.1 hypothetical protein [Candidatus Wukongarchaeota archaeon]